MKKVRFPAAFLSFLLVISLICPVSAQATGPVIDTSTASDGYFTVDYGSAAQQNKMKVGVTHDGETAFYTYVPGEASAYAFMEGNGRYTLTLYRNVRGTTYKAVTSTRVDVQMDSPLTPYLVSTGEITFSPEDTVGQKAAALCAGKTLPGAKVAAIYRYIAGNFSYDRALGAKASQGLVVNYVPDTAKTLESKTGICYDFSALFAAMCRSQGIPCAVAKGYLNGQYHAWNMVYVNGRWSAVDMTRAIANHDTSAATFADCVISLSANGYTGMDF